MELSERDVSIVRFVARYGQVSSKHIYFECFTTRSFTPCDTALQRLCKHRFLQRMGRRASDPVKGGAGASIYRLGRNGWAMTGQEGDWEPRQVSDKTRHHLAVADRYVELAGAARIGVCQLMTPPQPEKYIGSARCDLYVELGNPVRRTLLDVALEVEITGRKKRIQGKFRAYLEATKGWPGHFPLVVFAVPDEAHKAEVTRVLNELTPEERQYFACLLFGGFAGELLKLA